MKILKKIKKLIKKKMRAYRSQQKAINHWKKQPFIADLYEKSIFN
jgi:hypothetical protein